ncbi:energy-coupling factor transporter transmembrane component T family protein [Thermosediminibacter litoriperuensis]|uniref:Cobalt/nickel transport system permease protein n=1 Tax=Thermosediminibacter litoriperuensis TaxID=291989 RepID=A0A5S5AWZ4_9FIRM|nr:energy-coupling factor transporter transmembrane component T [Thermosediminibacter litoriperuensis]TYP57879.1 cobalt/nickel transport system permease protein [Thermosediminibacter litoriperuensis]
MNNAFELEEQKGNLFQRLDGRVKLISAVLYVAVVTTIHTWEYLVACFLLYLILLCILGFPVLNALRRIIWPVLFVGVMNAALIFINFYANQQYGRGAVLFLRALCAILVLNTAISSMTFRDLLFSMRALHVPDVLVNLVGFTVRYADILTDELSRMMIARKARGYAGGKNFWHTNAMKVIGQTVAVLFLRSFERSERVYSAMLSRGYSGDIRLVQIPEKPGKKDLLVGAAVVAVPLAFKIAELGAVSWITR